MNNCPVFPRTVGVSRMSDFSVITEHWSADFPGLS